LLVKKNGNHVYVAKCLGDNIVSFPTKNHWKDPSDIGLIKQSALELVEMTDQAGWNKVYLSWPGCGLGGLNKEQVRKVIQPIFDDRFYILTLK
jgi:hypothetical protein